MHFYSFPSAAPILLLPFQMKDPRTSIRLPSAVCFHMADFDDDAVGRETQKHNCKHKQCCVSGTAYLCAVESKCNIATN